MGLWVIFIFLFLFVHTFSPLPWPHVTFRIIKKQLKLLKQSFYPPYPGQVNPVPPWSLPQPSSWMNVRALSLDPLALFEALSTPPLFVFKKLLQSNVWVWGFTSMVWGCRAALPWGGVPAREGCAQKSWAGAGAQGFEGSLLPRVLCLETGCRLGRQAVFKIPFLFSWNWWSD